MFRESIKKMVDRVDGSLAGILMGFDGISVEAYTRPNAETDIQTVGMELSHVITQVRKAADLLEVGTLDEVTLRADKLVVVVRVVDPEYFLAYALRPDANFGKARYVMRVVAPQIKSEL